MNSAVTALPDKFEVQYGFSEAACRYDRYADHHRLIADRLMDFAPLEEISGNVLEIGCGTGILTEQLLRTYPHSRMKILDISPAMVSRCRSKLFPSEQLSFLVADAEEYCRRGNSFDLVASSCSLQWFHDRNGFLRNLRNMLPSDGFYLMAIPVKGMLHELAESCWNGAKKPMLQLDLASAEEWISCLDHCGLETQFSSIESVSCVYNDPLEVLKAIRGIGAGIDQGSESLKPGEMRRMAEYYRERYKAKGTAGVTSTYRILYVSGSRK